MLELAAERTDGAHPYNTTPEHTAFARSMKCVPSLGENCPPPQPSGQGLGTIPYYSHRKIEGQIEDTTFSEHDTRL